MNRNPLFKQLFNVEWFYIYANCFKSFVERLKTGPFHVFSQRWQSLARHASNAFKNKVDSGISTGTPFS